MVETPSSSDLFSRAVDPARAKIVVLGPADHLPGVLKDRICSLQFEHVSPATLMRQEISRPARKSETTEGAILSALRRWFWTRKPDAGFLLKDFPATMLQARVLDEWLEARSEALDAVLIAPGADQLLIDYYRTHGLVDQAEPTFAR